MKLLACLFAVLFLATPAVAGDMTVSVRDAAGRPVPDAVVTITPTAGAPAGPIRFAWPLQVAQRDIHFQPYVLIAPVGGTVSFPNFDRVRHHVYSFSRGNRFEIDLFGRDQTRTHAFATAGVVAIGCNIHDQMLAYIRVVDTPWAAKTGANGDVVLHGVPNGAATVRVWHPQLSGRGNEQSQAVTIASAPGRRTMTGTYAPRPAGH